ncbi:MAG: hypothetical protein M1816_005243 [Peltula sp. TS41687]|nr:MAG: hypothetical protein M1816_005243 [Peltula sp. TS41687]
MREQRKLANEFILEMANSAPRKPVAHTTTQGMAHRTPEEPQREGRPSWLEEPTEPLLEFSGFCLSIDVREDDKLSRTAGYDF